MRAPLLAILLSCSTYAAQDAVEDGAVAPAGRWTTSGGYPARTGESLSRPVRRDPEVAWRLEMHGEIESEPLVWDGRVVVSVREAPQRRAVSVLELETGRTLLHRRLPATVPLEPSIWGDRIALRPSVDRVDLYQIRGTRMLPLRTFRAVSSMAPPLLFGDELYLRSDSNLVRFDLDENEEEWSSDGGGSFRGRPSVRGDAVYALGYEPNGRAYVARLRRRDGRLTARVGAGHHEGRLPDVDAFAELYVHESNVFVHYPLPVPSTRGPALDFGRLGRRPTGFSSSSGSLHGFGGAPVPWADGWVALESEGDALRWVTGRTQDGQLRLVVLADADNHPELLATSAPASRAGDVLYLGGLAARLDDHTILWQKDIVPTFRPVPADGYVVMVEGGSTLLALREPEPVLDQNAAAAARAVERLDREMAEGYAGLALTSLRIGDPDLTERLLGEALGRGARGKTIESVENGLDALEARTRNDPTDPRRLKALQREEEALLARPSEELASQARAATEPGLRLALLRALLQRDPENAAALELIRGFIPPDAPDAEAIDPRSWLDFLDVQVRTPVSFFHPTEEGAMLTPEFEALSREVLRWRPDLDGYRSRRLFVVTPPGQPGAVARCLEIGELVCDLLEDLLEIDVSAEGHDPLTLLLYESKDEYVDQSRKAGSGPEIALGWTAGHYSVPENVSRMFVPADDVDLHELLGVYAHELTHHWLATQAPFARKAPDPDQHGYWVAEGFAIMVEEYQLDPRGRTWSPENPRAQSLDTVANAAPDQLLPWDTFFDLTFRDVSLLDHQPTMSMPLTWRLGMRAEKSEIQMFYAQAGATCHYLSQLSPGSRKELIDYLVAWYEGDDVRTSVQWTFGLSPEDLGEAIVAYAREAIRPR